MAEQMRAVVIDVYGDPKLAHTVEVPKPKPGPREVLIKVESSPINPSDLYFMMGGYGKGPLPTIPGREGSGTVVETGETAADLLGKRVHLYGNDLWSEYKVAKAEECVPLLDSVDFDQGAALSVNPVTVMMFKELIKTGGHLAAVQDAANSSLGKMLIRMCRLDGVPLINVVRSAKSAEAIRAEGAENILDSSDPNFATDYKALCERLGATICFDAIAGETTGQLLSGLCPGGVVQVYGRLSGKPSSGLIAQDLLFLGKRVEGKFMPGWLGKKSTEEKARLYGEIQRLIGDVFKYEVIDQFPIEQVQEAIAAYSANMSAGKILLHPSRQ